MRVSTAFAFRAEAASARKQKIRKTINSYKKTTDRREKQSLIAEKRVSDKKTIVS
jgi:hypothetical protein